MLATQAVPLAAISGKTQLHSRLLACLGALSHMALAGEAVI